MNKQKKAPTVRKGPDIAEQKKLDKQYNQEKLTMIAVYLFVFLPIFLTVLGVL